MVIVVSLLAIAFVATAVLGTRTDARSAQMEPVRIPVYSKDAYRSISKR